MPIVFGAIVPHPPILIPAVGQTNQRYVRKTRKALENLSYEFYHSKPDSLLIITPHGTSFFPDAFSINHVPRLKADFQEFGDLETRLEFICDIGLSYKIKQALETTLPLILTAEEKIDHGLAVPLHFLLKNLKKLPIIPLSTSGLDIKIHFELGEQIRQFLEKCEQRVAVVASADLSQTLSRKSPAGYSPKAKDFDKLVIDLLEQKKYGELLNLEEDLINEVKESGLKSIAVILGVFKEINYRFITESYEASLGVGHLVGKLELR